jgi:EAL domain-containing protein (putative c-di-GMP-specific phosphodiesterase class I)
MELLNRYRIAPNTLILEVTESRRIDDPQAAVTILRPLRNAGCALRWTILAWATPGCVSSSI